MKKSVLNQPIIDIPTQIHGQAAFEISAHRGKKIVLFFYPKDNTPGCTQESCDFRDLMPQFATLNTLIVGISRDSLASHTQFQTQHGLCFSLISDTDSLWCDYFDVIKPKNRYGKISMGVERSTFLINQAGILVREWRGVRVAGHVAEVLAAVAELDS